MRTVRGSVHGRFRDLFANKCSTLIVNELGSGVSQHSGSGVPGVSREKVNVSFSAKVLAPAAAVKSRVQLLESPRVVVEGKIDIASDRVQPDNLVLHLVPNKNTVPHTPGADPLREPVYGRSVIASWSTGTNPPSSPTSPRRDSQSRASSQLPPWR